MGIVAPGFCPWPSATSLPAGQPLAKADVESSAKAAAAPAIARLWRNPRLLLVVMANPFLWFGWAVSASASDERIGNPAPEMKCRLPMKFIRGGHRATGIAAVAAATDG